MKKIVVISLIVLCLGLLLTYNLGDGVNIFNEEHMENYEIEFITRDGEEMTIWYSVSYQNTIFNNTTLDTEIIAETFQLKAFNYEYSFNNIAELSDFLEDYLIQNLEGNGCTNVVCSTFAWSDKYSQDWDLHCIENAKVALQNLQDEYNAKYGETEIETEEETTWCNFTNEYDKQQEEQYWEWRKEFLGIPEDAVG